jgi:hypothetical protein
MGEEGVNSARKARDPIKFNPDTSQIQTHHVTVYIKLLYKNLG